jgi:hypothetical protein
LTPKGFPVDGSGNQIVGAGRMLYPATNGDLYGVVGNNVYYIDSGWNFTPVGALPSGRTNPVYAADNGKNILVVDGSTHGVQINMATRAGGPIADPNFLGADRICFLNYFLLLNQPGTSNFYSTNAASTVFNALSFGTMTEWPGNCIALINSQAAVWLFNIQKGEIWNDAGTFPFAFQPISGTIIEHGLVGPYALGRISTDIYWLSEAPEGARVAIRGTGRGEQRVSTFPIEAEWLTYPNVSDCVVQTYQIRGHGFVMWHFPSADRTWVYDLMMEEWHEEAFYDINGLQHRTRDMMMAYAYGTNLSLDWANGQLYARDEENFSINGDTQIYLVDYPHLEGDAGELSRFTIWRVICDMISEASPGLSVPQTTNPWSSGWSPGFGPSTVMTAPPYVTMQISYDRGKTFWTHSDQLLTGPYGYNTKPTFNRCGVAYDAVLRFTWPGPYKTAMNPPFVVYEDHAGDV